MALLLYRLGKFSYRHRWLVISLWLAVLVAVGGSAAAFHGTMSNNFQIPGTETQQMADKLKKELPHASGGSAGIVFEASDGQFTQAGKDAVSAALTKLEGPSRRSGHRGPVRHPGPAGQGRRGPCRRRAEGGRRQGPAGRSPPPSWPRARPSWPPPNSR